MEWWIVAVVAFFLVYLLSPWGVTPWRRFRAVVEIFRGDAPSALKVTRALQRRGVQVGQAIRFPEGRTEVTLTVPRGDEPRARVILSGLSLAQRYAPLVREVTAILHRHDPIHIGLVEDEYEPEARSIVARLDEATAPEDLRPIVHDVFVWWFSPEDAGSEERYERIAHEIWRLWAEEGPNA